MFFWTEPHPKACTVYFVCCWHSGMVLMHSNAFCGALSLFPLGLLWRHRECLSLASWRKECKILGVGLEFGTEILLKGACQAKRTLVCLIRCWHSLTSAFGFPQPQESLFRVWIESREWAWSTIRYHLWEASWALCSLIVPPVSLPGKNCINEPCSWRIPSFEVQVRMENKPCLLPLCSECNLFLGDSN